MISTKPGAMKAVPPISAPAIPRSRQAQKIASCVDAGPGKRLVAAMPCSKSSAEIQRRRVTHRSRSSAMCAGGPPNPMQPILPHSRRSVPSPTGWSAASLAGVVVAAPGSTAAGFSLMAGR